MIRLRRAFCLAGAMVVATPQDVIQLSPIDEARKLIESARTASWLIAEAKALLPNSPPRHRPAPSMS